MTNYVVCSELVDFARKNPKYATNILMKFIHDNSLKVCFDKKGKILDSYAEIIYKENGDFIKSWLDYLNLNPENNIKNIEVTDQKDLKLTNIKVCESTFDKTKLISNEKEDYLSYKNQLTNIKIIDREEAVDELNLSELVSKNKILSKLPINKDNLLEIAIDICNEFSKLVENNYLWKSFYNNNGKGDEQHENAPQRIFGSIARVICDICKIDISPETNSGAGALDFKLSVGSIKVNIEVKYAHSTHLISGYKEQLNKYNLAEDTNKSIYLVIRTDKSNETNIERLKEEEKKEKKRNQETPKIIVIDARKKVSASKL